MFGRSGLKKGIVTTAAAMVGLLGARSSAGMQTATAADESHRLCGQAVPAPAQLPPADSSPVVYFIGVCFSAQGNVSAVEPQTYLFYIRLQPSRSSQGQWIPYDDSAIDTIREDFRRLWDTRFLDDLKIEATDYVFENGVVGKLITYHLEERERIKRVSYEGTTAITRSQIDDALRDRNIELRLDSFLDQGTITRAKGVVRDLMIEKGFTNAEVVHTVTPVAGGPKLVGIIFNIDNGPKMAIRDVAFVGNRAFSDAELEKAMKENRAESLTSFIDGSGKYNEQKFAEDAQLVEDHYRNHGYISARVGTPELRRLDDSADRTTRWIQLRIPITEGMRYRIGSLAFEGNQIVPADALRRFFEIREGELYSQQKTATGSRKRVTCTARPATWNSPGSRICGHGPASRTRPASLTL